MERVVKSFETLGAEQWGGEWPGSSNIVSEMDSNIASQLGGMYAAVLKAVATGNINGYGDSTPLLLENLDDVMTSVLFKQEHLVLWNLFNRVVSRQPFFEYNERLRYGGGRRTPGFGEGGVPKNATSAWQRKGTYVKWMGVKRGITHQSLVTGALGGAQIAPAEEEERNGTLDLLQLIERWFLHGDKDIKKAGGAEVNYDGLLRQMEAFQTAGVIGNDHIKDMKGGYIKYDDLEDDALTLQIDGKLQSTTDINFIMHPKIGAGLSKQMVPSQRVQVAEGNRRGEYTFGLPVTEYLSNLGPIPFKRSIFLDEVEGDAPLLVADNVEDTAPAAPGVPVATASADAGADWGGTWYYFVSALNDGGESLATAEAGGVVVATAEKVTLAIPRVNEAEGYRIYRGTVSDGSDARICSTIPQPSSGDASFVDKNERIPGTHYSFMFHNDREDITVAQMSPLVKFPLGITSTTIEFLLLLYHVMVLKTPKRCIVYKNVGAYPKAA